MGTQKNKIDDGLFGLRLSPYIRISRVTTWVNIGIRIDTDTEQYILEYTAQAHLVPDGVEVVRAHVQDCAEPNPQSWIEVMDALAIALPPGSYGGVHGTWLNLTFQTPNTPPASATKAIKKART